MTGTIAVVEKSRERKAPRECSMLKIKSEKTEEDGGDLRCLPKEVIRPVKTTRSNGAWNVGIAVI